MGTLNEFIENVKALTNMPTVRARHITTDVLCNTPNYDFAVPINGYILIDGRCDSRVIIENGNITTYVLVSKNMITFNKVAYALVYAIQEDRGNNRRRTCMHLSGAEALAIHCDNVGRLVAPVSDNEAFIAEPSKHVITEYRPTEKENVFERVANMYDITSKLSICFKEDGMYISPKAAEPPQ